MEDLQGDVAAETPVAEADLGELVAPLAGLLGRVAASRLAPLLGAGRVDFAGMAAEVPADAARATAALLPAGEGGAWVRAALEPGLGGGGRAQDDRALALWLEGIGPALGQLLGTASEPRAVQAEERMGPEVPDVPVLAFELHFARRQARAWLWMEAGLLGRCLEALGPGDPGPGAAQPWDAAELAPGGPAPSAADRDAIGLLLDVPLGVSVELGRNELQIRDVLGLVPGSVVELDRLAGDPLDVLINGRRIARGEVVVVDERFAVRITEILTPRERVERLR